MIGIFREKSRFGIVKLVLKQLNNNARGNKPKRTVNCKTPVPYENEDIISSISAISRDFMLCII